ncbi:nucleotide-sugar transporter [Myriangium duriaei CBS 260.36]|uniref:Nucleotide-sugar transporter n=1 Tax=Myriangium duriaei CBS 260.36 TaxID=1168546 RepID=A0A9P4J2Z0_9PEZI|nr:nucleotide-sugar transporter [Myriangium duriaei CBS 260.36]
MEQRRRSVIMGMSAKHVTLFMLTVQNSALILIMHYSRMMPPVGGHRYLTSTAVFLNEVFKLAISLSMALHDVSKDVPASAPATALFSELFGQVFTGDSWKLAVPAMLYTLQNSLQYVAVSNLNAATFQVTYQLKILSTAIFSVLLLSRKISAQKWLSLVMLMVGVAVVQIPADPSAPTIQDLKDESDWTMPRSLEEMRKLGNVAAGQLLGKRSATYEGIDKDFAVHNPQLNASAGLAAVIGACVLSGLAGVYFEKVLKESGTHVSIWIRNVQLSFYSLFPALFIGVMFKDGAEISKYGFFTGYNWVVWSAILCQATGGVIVSLSIFHTSNIAKNFATSISILLSFLVSVFFFDFKITFSFVAGTAIVLGATYLYSIPQSSQGKPPQVVTSFEKHGHEEETPSYFYTDKTNDARLDTPRSVAHTSSLPATPTSERRHPTKALDTRFTKRDE